MEKREKEPIHTVDRGRIQLPIWENQREDGSAWYNVTVKRLYKANAEWCEAQSFGREDLLGVAEGMTEAYRWIWNRASEAKRATKTSRVNAG